MLLQRLSKLSLGALTALIEAPQQPSLIAGDLIQCEIR